MTTEKELLQFCRYYKGEDKCDSADGNIRLMWICEEHWVYHTIEIIKEKGRREKGFKEKEVLFFSLDEYLAYGLGDFEKYDGTPLTLKATLFNRYCKHMDFMDVEGFKTFYKNIYHRKCVE